ncbi:NAD(P)H-hydrate epimerase, partial [Streptomyces sp. NPDC058861]|uniref:NAD(P)H-hydrate epimerase n=1 Tax=Streptomyces sp. NPDC058861 TaxID=3346653 RepID=UPI003692249D
MRTAYRVETVRAAEAALMARLPEGALMGRAAAGLAAACCSLLGRGRVYGARVVLLVGTGDNGGDALYAGARLARRGAGVTVVLLGARAHEGGLAALRAAGGRIADDPFAPLAGADLVLDGITGIGGRGGLRPDAVPVARAARGSDAVVVAGGPAPPGPGPPRGRLSPRGAVPVYAIDVFDTPASAVKDLHARGRKVIC